MVSPLTVSQIILLSLCIWMQNSKLQLSIFYFPGGHMSWVVFLILITLLWSSSQKYLIWSYWTWSLSSVVFRSSPSVHPPAHFPMWHWRWSVVRTPTSGRISGNHSVRILNKVHWYGYFPFWSLSSLEWIFTSSIHRIQYCLQWYAFSSGVYVSLHYLYSYMSFRSSHILCAVQHRH